MPLPFSKYVSAPTLAVPLPARCAPLAFTEFAQPLPAAPELPHGQAVPLPSPKQNGVDGVDGGASTSCTPLNVAKLVNVEIVITMLPPAAMVTVSTACVVPTT